MSSREKTLLNVAWLQLCQDTSLEGHGEAVVTRNAPLSNIFTRHAHLVVVNGAETAQAISSWQGVKKGKSPGSAPEMRRASKALARSRQSGARRLRFGHRFKNIFLSRLATTRP